MILVPTTICGNRSQQGEPYICIREKGHEGLCRYEREAEVWVEVPRLPSICVASF
jgi:hypothetical protein